MDKACPTGPAMFRHFDCPHCSPGSVTLEQPVSFGGSACATCRRLSPQELQEIPAMSRNMSQQSNRANPFQHYQVSISFDLIVRSFVGNVRMSAISEILSLIHETDWFRRPVEIRSLAFV